MRDADDIIQLISRAFAETPQPGPEALFNDHCCECVEVSAAYGGKRWMDISLEDILAGRETALLTAAAWRCWSRSRRWLPTCRWCTSLNRRPKAAACQSGSRSARLDSLKRSGRQSWPICTGLENVRRHNGPEPSHPGTLTTL